VYSRKGFTNGVPSRYVNIEIDCGSGNGNVAYFTLRRFPGPETKDDP
jgi:hypothetical protein